MGESGDDEVSDEENDDTVIGGEGDDCLSGDALWVAGNEHGKDYMDDGAGKDWIEGGCRQQLALETRRLCGTQSAPIHARPTLRTYYFIYIDFRGREAGLPSTQKNERGDRNNAEHQTGTRR